MTQGYINNQAVSGYSGFSGYSGYTGVSGYSGYTGVSGYSGYTGVSGYSGFSGKSGYSGYTGISGYSGYTGISGYSGFTGVSGYSGYTGVSGYSGYTGVSGYSGFSGPSLPSIKMVEPIGLQHVVGTIVTKAGTVTGTAGVGSSLFLSRVTIPAIMSISELQVAMKIDFQATNNGQGTMSRSFCLYSFGNSTSLASVISKSGTQAWTSGTSTAGGSASLTQFQGGWSVPLIQPFTFASSTVAAGEYVVGQIFDFAQLNSTWTLNFYGAMNASTLLASAATGIASTTLGVLSSGGLQAASGITVLGILGTGSAGATFWGASFASSAASSFKTTTSIWTFIDIPMVTQLSTLAGSIHTGTSTVSAVTNVALAALASTTLAQLTLPNFGFLGSGSTTSGFPTVFEAGIMSTGAIPTAITLTSNAVTYSGSIAFQQPWFILAG